MRQIGWDVGFFSMHHENNLKTPWSKYFVEEIEFGKNYSLVKKMAMASKVIYSFEAQKNLLNLLRDHKFNVAHLHCIYHHLSPSILPILADAGVRVVLTAHDLKIACPAYKMLNNDGICERCREGTIFNIVRYRCIKNSLAASSIVAMESGLHKFLRTYQNYVDRIVVPSKFFFEKLVEWGWSREKLIYIPNYVDREMFVPHYRVGKYFVYFGRLSSEKGVSTLIKAAVKANVKLFIVGTGPEEVALRKIASGYQENIVFLGYKSGQELREIIQGARAVVLPSEWYENAPMSILEGMALGKIVIGSDIGGIPELVKNNETGWLFESGSPDALSHILEKASVMDDRVLEAMGFNARTDVVARFGRDSYKQAMVNLYAELGVF